MSLKRIYAIFVRQMFLVKSNPARLASIFLWIIISVIQWGFISKYLGTLGGPTFSFINVILGAIIIWEFTTRIQQGILTSFLEDVWVRNFINYFSSPLKVSEYIAGLVLTSLVTGIIGFVFMFLIALLGFGYNVFQLGLIIFLFLLILFIFGMAIGIFVAGVVFRLGPAAEWISWPIPVVLSIFAGVFYPISILPGSLQVIAKILPPSYIFESVRGVLSSGVSYPQLIPNLIIGALLSLVYLVLAFLFFTRVYHRNLKEGSIARFSAESL
jgi:ABC-2 type transport system permease protein